MADDDENTTSPSEGEEGTPEADDAAGAPEADDAAGEPETGEEVAEATPAEVQPMVAAPNPVRDRLWLPLVLPLAAMAAIAVFVLNISRVLLASGNGAGSVVVGTIVTLVILVGAAVISASPRLRTSTLTMTLSAMMVVVVGAGLITLGPSEGHEGSEEGFVEPEGDPTSTLEVDALPQLRFQSDEFTAPGGILGIDYVGRGGNHTLLFEDPQYRGFILEVSGEETDSGKVEIAEGEYVIYCDVPGHRAAGMEATLTVTPPPPGAEPPAEEEGETTTTAGG